MKESVLEKVRAFIEETQMISRGEKVLVALSGGADSVAMTHILLTLSGEFGFSLCAAHLNHCLRGTESDGDEIFVRKFCEKLDIPLMTERADINRISAEERLGTEECARNVRYDFLVRTANGFGASKIATAHTLSDNAETLIFNMVRGSGLNGLCGIPEVRGNFIRPILKLSRAETEGYNREEGLPFVVDSTNSDTEYTRNFIRSEIVPRLTEINPAFLNSVERLTSSVKEDSAFIEGEATRLISKSVCSEGYRLSVLESAAAPVLKRALSNMYYAYTDSKLSSRALNEFFEFAIDSVNGRLQLPKVFAVKNSGFLNLVDSVERTAPKRFYIDAQNVNILPDGRVVTITEFNSIDGVDNNCIDAGKISGGLRLRLRVPTDEIKLPKRPTKSLKKLFSEKRIPISERDKAVVICDDDGIVWVEKLGVAERTAATVITNRLLKIKTEE